MAFALNSTVADDLRTTTDNTGATIHTVRVNTHRSKFQSDALKTGNEFRWTGDVTVRHNVVDMRELQAEFRAWCENVAPWRSEVRFASEVEAAVLKAIKESCAGTIKSFELPADAKF